MKYFKINILLWFYFLFYFIFFSRPLLPTPDFPFQCRGLEFLLITLRDTPQSVGLPWTRDRFVAEACTWQQHTNTHKRQTYMPPVGFFFFFACPGFFPFDPFLYCLNPFILHVTLRSILPSLQQTQTNIHAPGEIRTHDPSKRAAADPRLRPRGHWDRP
jgi:hypothetical protein